MANVSPKVVFGMPFLILSGVNINFFGRELRWKIYTTKKALLTTRHIELVSKKEFTAVAFNPESETFIIYVASLSSDMSPSSSPFELNIHPFCRPQISDLIAKMTLIKVPAKYLNFADVFSLDLASKIFEHTGINDYIIELVNGQQLLYGSIYNPRPMELETLKAYIETNLVNRFFKPSKSLAGAPILFNQKSDDYL